jgi:lysophospholipase L1-like esterase
MRTRLLGLAVLLMFCGSTLAHAAPPATYYLALGDSLAIGVQPSAKGDVPTDHGYADDLFAVLHRVSPRLTLVKLGCSGETSTSMFAGGVCNAPGSGGQLAAAVSFLEAHQHQVPLITLDIGANDVDHCIDISTLMIDKDCLAGGLTAVGANLPYILATLQAASPDSLIVAMNYYDPFLAAWKLVPPPTGQELADESLLAIGGAPANPGLNTIIESVCQAYHVPVADVAKAFRIDNFTELPVLNLPINVFLTLTLTWMDAPPPLGPDIHPNAGGYVAIAGAFAEKVARP